MSQKTLKSNNKLATTNLIAIGSSAGGLEALQQFFINMPFLEDCAFIVAQHISPEHVSLLPSLLAKNTKYKVVQAKHNDTVSAGIVYITPPDNQITIVKNKIKLDQTIKIVGAKPNVDYLFNSIQVKEYINVFAVILSGTGSDGAQGAKYIHEDKGYVLVQKPQSAKFDGMPNATIGANVADFVVEPNEMGIVIEKVLHGKPADVPENLRPNNSYERFLHVLQNHTGVDFANYNHDLINKVLKGRINLLKLNSVDDYLHFLNEEPSEVDHIYNVIFEPTSLFITNKAVLKAKKQSLVQIVENKQDDEDVRIWIPGCGTGETAYQIAIILSEILEQKKRKLNVKVFATDIHNETINKARTGVFSTDELSVFDKRIVEKYFSINGETCKISKHLRLMVLFSRHDLINNPAFLKIDLINCNEVLNYFSSKLQQKALNILHYSLNANGVLFLGNSETAIESFGLFKVKDQEANLYSKNNAVYTHPTYSNKKSTKPAKSFVIDHKPKKIILDLEDSIKETLHKSYEFPYVLLNKNLDILESYGNVGQFLNFGSGIVHLNLLKMMQPDMLIEARSVLTKGIKEGNECLGKWRKFIVNNNQIVLRFKVKPLVEQLEVNTLYILIFEFLEIDKEFATLVNSIHIIPNKDNIVINELKQELEATKEHLQNYIEELETGNEELQTLNEELQSTNEELQASTEELEASNEALQSANEEIRVAYDELNKAHENIISFDKQLKLAFASLEALINSNEHGIVLVDDDYKLLFFNNKAAEFNALYNTKKMHKNAFYLDYISSQNLHLVKNGIDNALRGEGTEIELTETDKLGTNKVYAVYFNPVKFENGDIFGVSANYKDITAKAIVAKVESETKQKIQSMFSASADIIYTLDLQQKHTSLYGASFELEPSLKDYFIGKDATELLGHDMAKVHIDANSRVLKGESLTYEWSNIEYGQTKYFQTSVSPMYDNAHKIIGIMGVGRDITQHKQASLAIEHSELRYKALFQNSLMPYMLCNISSFVILDCNKAFLKLFNLKKDDAIGAEIDKLISITNLKSLVDNIISESSKSKTIVFKQIEVTLNQKCVFLQLGAFSVNKNNQDEIVISFSDETETINLIEQVKQDARRYENITNNISDMVWTTDLSIRCNFVSPSVLNIFGYTPEEFLNTSLTDLFNKSSIQKLKSLYEKMQHLIESGNATAKELFKIELEGIRKDGKSIILSNNLRFLFDANGFIAGILGVTSNITAEKAYENDLKKFKSIVDQSLVGSLITDFNGKILYANKSVAAMHGYQPQELLNKSISVFFNVNQMKSLADLLANIKTSGYVNTVEMVHVAKGGSELKTLVSGQAVFDETGAAKFFTYHISDITKIKQIEQTMQKVNERYHFASKAVSDAVWDFDMLANTIELSENFTSLFGSITYSDIKTQIDGVLKLLHPDELQDVLNDFKDALKGSDITWKAEHLFLKNNGEYAHVLNKAFIIRNSEGKAIRVIGAMQDITRQKQEAISLKLYETTLKHIKDAILITEPITEDGQLVTSFVNDAFVKLTGFKPEDILGKSPTILNGPGTSPESLAKIFEAIADVKTVDTTMINYKKNGEEFWSEASISPVFDISGNVVKWVAIYRDVSDQVIKQQQTNLLNHLRVIFSDSTNSLKDLLDNAIHYLITEIGFDLGEVWVVDSNNKYINLISNKAVTEKVYNDFYRSKEYNYKFEKGVGFPGLVWSSNKIEVFENVGENKLFMRQEAANNAGIKTVFGIPLTYGKQIKGALLFGSTQTLTQKNKYDYLFDNVEEILGSELERLIFKEDINRFFAVSSEVMCIAGFDGYYKKVNPFMCELLEYTEEEILSKPVFEFVYKEDLKNTTKEFEQIVKEGKNTYNFKNRCVTKSGRIVWLNWSTKIFQNEGLTYSMARDITAQKYAEDIIHRSGKLAKVGAFELYIPKNQFYMSNLACELLEIPVDVTMSLSGIIDMIYPNYQEEARNRFETVIQQGTREVFEVPVMLGNSRTKWFKAVSEPELFDGKCIRMFTSFQDITEIKEAQNKLLNTLNDLTATNERFIKVTQATNDAIWDWDLETNEVFKSAGYINLFGKIEGEELASPKGWKLRIHPDDVHLVEESISNALGNLDNELWKCEYRFLRSNNTYAYVEDRGYIIRNKFKKAIRIVGAMSDITKYKKSIEAIKLQNDKLHEIAFSQSHVVRAPVSRIMGLNTLIQDPDTPIEEKLKCLEFIDKSCKELDKIILDIVLKTHDLDNIVKTEA